MKCPECKSKHIIKKGKLNVRYGSKQRYLCKDCGRRFVDRELKYKTYPPRVIYSAINYYGLGYNLQAVSTLVNKAFRIKTSRTTIHSWIREFQHLTAISSMREHFTGDKDILFTKRFEHENLDYEFMYHKYKLDVLVKERFPGLTRYITRFEGGCPDTFFEIGERCSKPRVKTNVKVKKKMNLACRMAGFAIQAARNNRERHKAIETFMLINDKATIACEIPVWYWDKKIDNGVTGHIDLLQVRNGLVYILDYKPGASKDKKASNQLYHYAVALSYRTKIPLDSIRCAWFDEDAYYEYNPAEVDVALITKV